MEGSGQRGERGRNQDFSEGRRFSDAKHRPGFSPRKRKFPLSAGFRMWGTGVDIGVWLVFSLSVGVEPFVESKGEVTRVGGKDG